MKPFHTQFVLRLALLGTAVFPVASAFAGNWYSWRGPNQNGTCSEKYEKQDLKEEPLWTYELKGRGAPVIADGRLYQFGYKGSGPQLVETLTCLDAEKGTLIWEKKFADFLSDNAYERYSIGSPTIDPMTGKIYLMTTTGMFGCWDKDGKELWMHSLMEEVGRLSFPNGRTGAPVIVGDLVIVRGITANWGGDGPARDRFYAYDKASGDLVWASTPAEQPDDSSFSTPYLDFKEDGTALIYATCGCGNYVAINALNGKPQWRWKGAKSGINSSIVKHKGLLISIHDKENVDNSSTGRMAAFKLPTAPLPPVPEPEDLMKVQPGWDTPVLEASAEVWRLPLTAETSSPILADGKIYQLDQSGNLICVNADSGNQMWEMKLAPCNTHSSPLWADGLIYAPLMNDVSSEDGLLLVVKPGEDKGEVVHKVKLSGFCTAPPSICNGKLYLATVRKIYCFQIATGKITDDAKWLGALPGKPGPAVALQISPSEFLLHPGQSQSFRVRQIDAKGYTVGEAKDVKWETFIPKTAKVKATVEDAAFDAKGNLVAKPDARQGAGAFKATSGTLSGVIRGRIIADLPSFQDFEKFQITEKGTAPKPDGTMEEFLFAYPPLPWMGARFKWEVRELDGNKVLYKTLSPVFFQRATTFLGSPEMKDYTVEADMMTDGNRRMKSVMGLVNQRYLIILNGNANEIEVSSNQERLKVNKPFPITANAWYHMTTRVDLSKEGKATIRAKAWKKEETEPAEWSIEVEHENGHTNGSPGIFGFALQGQKAVYLDNINITPNKK